MSHIDIETLHALYMGTLSQEEQLAVLGHMRHCEYCTMEFAAFVESGELLRAPANLKSSILSASKSLPVQMAAQQRKSTKRMQLLIYSLKVSTAIACTLLLLGTVNMNTWNPTLLMRAPESAQALPDLSDTSIVSAMHQRTNELTANFSNFSNNLIQWR